MLFSILIALLYRYLVLLQKVDLMKKWYIITTTAFIFVLIITPVNLSIYRACTNNIEAIWEDTKTHFPEIFAYAKDENCFAFSIRVDKQYVRKKFKSETVKLLIVIIMCFLVYKIYTTMQAKKDQLSAKTYSMHKQATIILFLQVRKDTIEV